MKWVGNFLAYFAPPRIPNSQVLDHGLQYDVNAEVPHIHSYWIHFSSGGTQMKTFPFNAYGYLAQYATAKGKCSHLLPIRLRDI